MEDPVPSPAHHAASRNGCLPLDRARGRRHLPHVPHVVCGEVARGHAAVHQPEAQDPAGHRRAEGGEVPDRQRGRSSCVVVHGNVALQ